MWNIPDGLILYAAKLCRDYYNPLKNLHSLLSYYKNNNIFSVSAAEKVQADTVLGGAAKASAGNFQKRDYSKEELNAMFTSVEDYEV
jgi:hypothetical protein